MATRAFSEHHSPPVAAAAAGAIALAAAVGASAGLLGWETVPAILAAGVGIAILLRPFVGLLLLVAIIPVENLVASQGMASPVKIVGAAVFGAWLVGKFLRRESWRPVLSNALFVTTMLFLALALTSVSWARFPMVARQGFISLALLAGFAFLTLDIASTSKRIDSLIKALVLSATLAVALIVYQYEFVGLRRAGEDVAGGVNDTAVLLLTTLPLGFYLLRSSRGLGWRVLGISFIPLASLGIALTFSRFNLLLIPPVLLLLFVLTFRERATRSWLLSLVAVGSVIAVLLVPWDEVRERAETIEPYLTGTLQFGEVQAETSPRGYHLRIGLAIARDHPILGVGYGNYGYYFLQEYQYQVSGRGSRVYGTPRSPHSSYIGIAADLGLVGLALWCSVLLTAVVSVWRAWRQARLSGDRAVVFQSESLAVALGVYVLAYAWYSPIQQSKLLWLVLGMCMAVARVTAVGAQPEDSASS